MKRFILRLWPITLIFLLLLTLSLPVYAARVPSVDNTQFIHDFAGLLSHAEVQELSQLSAEYGDKHGMDFVIVVADDSLGKSPRQYAEQFYDENDFGRGSNYDGILFLINMTDRDIYIDTVGGAITYFYDSDVDALLDRAADAMGASGSSSVPYKGALVFLEGADAHISAGQSNSGTPLRPSGEAPSNYYQYDIPLREQYGVGFIILVCIAGSAIVSGIVLGIMVLLHKRSLASPPRADTYLGREGIQITRRTDRFLHTHTSRKAIPQSSSSGGGGSGGGGGSSHRSSGGRSHGGGGRKF